MKEEWLFPAALIPVDRETTHALVAEIKRLIDVVGGMALAQRTWVRLTDEEIKKWWASENGLEDCDMCKIDDFVMVARAIEAKLKEKNT